MKVSLTRQGGFLDLNQRVEVNEGQVSITEAGATRGIVPVDAATAKRVADLAKVVAGLPQDDTVSVGSETPAYDEMLTEIEIEEAGTVHRLAVVSGADAPRAVWELISAVDRCVGG